jgi:hypothetical protein
MTTMTLTFDLQEESFEARAAANASRLAGALGEIDNIARQTLKHGGDSIKALEEIRARVSDAMAGVLE